MQFSCGSDTTNRKRESKNMQTALGGEEAAARPEAELEAPKEKKTTEPLGAGTAETDNSSRDSDSAREAALTAKMRRIRIEWRRSIVNAEMEKSRERSYRTLASDPGGRMPPSQTERLGYFEAAENHKRKHREMKSAARSCEERFVKATEAYRAFCQGLLFKYKRQKK